MRVARSAQIDCATFLLQRGVGSGIVEAEEEGPLHRISGSETAMKIIATLLIDTGLNIKEVSTSIKVCLADWDRLLSIPMTPLGRAVIAQKEDIKHLLGLGANPLGKGMIHRERRNATNCVSKADIRVSVSINQPSWAPFVYSAAGILWQH
jgi:hypothetical protein